MTIFLSFVLLWCLAQAWSIGAGIKRTGYALLPLSVHMCGIYLILFGPLCLGML